MTWFGRLHQRLRDWLHEIEEPFDFDFTDSAPPTPDDMDCPDTEPTSPGALDSDIARLEE